MADHDADREAIIALIHRNRIAIWTGDFETWETCFVHAPYTSRWGYWKQGGAFVRRGWEEIAARARIGGPPVNLRNAHDTPVENLILRIDGNMAWAIFEQHYPELDHARFDHAGPGIVQEMRVFERHGGEWKIALLGLLDSNGSAPSAALLQLDAGGRILWKSRPAIAALDADDDLVVRDGVLRFRNRKLDSRLRDALAWVAGRDTGLLSTSGSVPILVEAGEGLPTKIYWVVIDGGMIMFSFGSQRVDEDRLRLAGTIYELSPAQLRLAALVAEGKSLNEIAAEMKITPNTARTHLNRVFEKTGVRTQTALVRVLLSAISPV